jgi:hypothetical protein
MDVITVGHALDRASRPPCSSQATRAELSGYAWEMKTTQPGKYRTGLLFSPARSRRADSTVAFHQGACSCAISVISATFEFAAPTHGDVG